MLPLKFLSGLTCLSHLLISAALPVALAELTPSNFKETTAHGTWFIEHYSPFCHHCQAFAPTWEKLVGEVKSLGLPVETAQVNCATYGDLCTANGVNGYPQMTIFQEGKIVEQYKGSRELDLLIQFIKKHVDAPAPAPVQPDLEAHINDEPDNHPAPVHGDHDASRVAPNPNGEVLVLDDEGFAGQRSQGNAMFVKFYAPWCGHCKKLAPTWKLLAGSMKNKLTIAEVNCDDNSSLCAVQGVTGYPTLKFYGPNGVASEYGGSRKLEQLMVFVEKASASGITAIQDDQLKQYVADEKVVYLFLHSPSDTLALKTIQDAARVLLGSTHILTSSSSALWNTYGIPSSSTLALIALKDHDSSNPTAIYHDTSSAYTHSPATLQSQFEQWLLQNRIPTMTELTQDTFQGVMNVPNVAIEKGYKVSGPIVVLVASPPASSVSSSLSSGKVEERLNDLAKEWKVRTEGSGTIGGRQVVFAWMDRQRWGDWLKSMYGIPRVDEATEATGTLDDLKVVIVDHSDLVYWDTVATGAPIKLSSSQSVFSAIEGSVRGQIKYKHSENTIERMSRYFSVKIMALEGFIVNHPLWTVTLVISALGVFILFMRRILNEEEPIDHRKIGRMD